MIITSPLLDYVTSHHDIKAINQWRADVEQQIQEYYENGHSIRDVVIARSNLIDEALIFLWKHAGLDQSRLGLLQWVAMAERKCCPTPMSTS